jgi:hypothetical protein
MEREINKMFHPWHKEAHKIQTAEPQSYLGGYERSHIQQQI